MTIERLYFNYTLTIHTLPFDIRRREERRSFDVRHTWRTTFVGRPLRHDWPPRRLRCRGDLTLVAVAPVDEAAGDRGAARTASIPAARGGVAGERLVVGRGRARIRRVGTLLRC